MHIAALEVERGWQRAATAVVTRVCVGLLVSLTMDLLGLLRDLFSWVDKQGGFTQTMVATGFLTAGGLLWTGMKWSGRRISETWVRQRGAARARRDRLEPKPRIGLIEAGQVETKASTEFNEAIRRLVDASSAFNQRASGIKPKIDAAVASGRGREKVLAEATAALRQFAQGVKRGVTDLEKVIDQLSDSWSSRMYWHDKRGSAHDILKAAANVKALVVRSREAAQIYGGHKQSLEGWRGWTTGMDSVVDQYCNAVDRLVQVLDEFETLCQSILLFCRRESGIRGLARRLVRRMR